MNKEKSVLPLEVQLEQEVGYIGATYTQRPKLEGNLLEQRYLIGDIIHEATIKLAEIHRSLGPFAKYSSAQVIHFYECYLAAHGFPTELAAVALGEYPDLEQLVETTPGLQLVVDDLLADCQLIETGTIDVLTITDTVQKPTISNYTPIPCQAA